MIISDKYVYLHFPKTGGTFITNLLRDFYDNQLVPSYQNKNCIKRLFQTKPFFSDYKKNEILDDLLDKKGNHNGFSQIPKKHKTKPVFTTVRNPFDFYVSYYETKTWANEKLIKKQEIVKIFPSFPELSFEEFMEFTEYLFSEKLYKLIFKKTAPFKVGLYTLLIILLYSTDPYSCMSNLKMYNSLNNVPTSELIVSDHLIFLNFSDLNTELYNFLSPFYKRWDLKFIYDLPKANVSKRKSFDDIKDYYSEKTLKRIEEIDSLGLRFYHSKI